MQSLEMKVDPTIVRSERQANQTSADKATWRVNANVPLDFYFNPISYTFATRWLDPGSKTFKLKIIQKCVKLSRVYPAFAKVTCLLFFRDVHKNDAYLDDDTQAMQTAVLAGAKLLFQTDFKRLTTTFS